MTKTMKTPAQITKKVICKKSELGIRVGKEYTQVRKYSLFKGCDIRVVIVDGKEQNFEAELFDEVAE